MNTTTTLLAINRHISDDSLLVTLTLFLTLLPTGKPSPYRKRLRYDYVLARSAHAEEEQPGGYANAGWSRKGDTCTKHRNVTFNDCSCGTLGLLDHRPISRDYDLGTTPPRAPNQVCSNPDG